MIGMVLILWILQTVSGGGGLAFGLGGVPAEQYLGQALTHWDGHQLVHEKGTFSLNGHRYQLDVTEQRHGDGQGIVQVDGISLQYRYAGGRTYVLGPQDWWASRDPKLAAFLADKWATSPGLAAELSTTILTRSLSMLDKALPGKTFNRKGTTAVVNGTQAVRLSDATGDVYVSTAKPARFLRLVSSPAYRTADGVSAVRLDLDYPAALEVQPPDQAVDTGLPRTLPARYTVVEGSFKHAGNCDTGNSCTLTASVTNEGGPQVGAPSIEFHLSRADGADLGSCTAPIKPVANGQTEDVSCTVAGQAWVAFARVGGRYQAKADLHNPVYD